MPYKNVKEKIKHKVIPWVAKIRRTVKDEMIPENEMQPPQPGAPLPKVKIWDRVNLWLHKNRKPIGDVVATSGDVYGGPIGFILRVVGKLISGVNQAKEKVKSIDWAGVLSVILEFFASLFKKKKE